LATGDIHYCETCNPNTPRDDWQLLLWLWR